MKKLWVGVLVLVLLCGAAAAYASARGTYQGYPIVGVVVNGQELQPEVPAIIFNGKTLLPLRAVTEALGAKVEWNADTVTATVTLPRDLKTEEEMAAWETSFLNQLTSVWGDYCRLLEEREHQSISQQKFAEDIIPIAYRAQEVLQESASVTSSTSQELWGKIAGEAAVGALAYADILLTVAHEAGGFEGYAEPAQMAHQAMTKLLEASGVGENPNEALFDQYLSNLYLGRLPPQYSGQSDWPQHVVTTDTFSPGDLFVVMGEVKQSAELNFRPYNTATKQFADTGGAPGFPVQQGGFASCSPLMLPAGSYELWCYVGEDLVARLEFEVK